MKKTTRALLASALAVVLLALAHPAAAAPQGGGRSAEIIHEYTLPLFSLENLGYSPEDLATAQANGLITTERPAIGSGLQQLNGNYYISITDRGPTPDRADGFKAFPLPQFTPTIVLFKAIHDQIVPLDFLPLLNDLSESVTGLPNGPTDDAPGYPDLTSTTPLPFNPDGLDPEDLHMLPGGGFILVEEYSPSVVIVSPNGNVLKRYTPVGKTLSGAHYSVSDILPPVLKERRANRGFEGIAVSPDGRTAYTVTQSPMGSTSAASPYRDSRLVRIIRMDISDPLNLQVTGQFVVLMSPVADYPAGNAARDLKISATSWVSEDRLLFLERTDKPGSGGAKLLLVDLTEATDVTDFPEAAAVPLILEKVTTDLAALGITPATSRVILDVNQELPAITDFKLEGLSILNANMVALSNDNDFGIVDPNSASKVYEILLSQPLR